MIEEPYRWVEAIANRREYIDTELAAGSPIIGISFGNGILLLTFSRDRRKIFEIYDRIALGGIGHPGDLERLRMLAIELASTEGFTRSAADVSLRRMASYSFSPALKEAFEQVYGAPYLVKLLFAEVGHEPSEDTLLRIDYDGSTHANVKPGGGARENFGAIAGTRRGLEEIEKYLRGTPASDLKRALDVAIRAWGIGLYFADQDHTEMPENGALKDFIKSQLEEYSLEGALLERGVKPPRVSFTNLPSADVEAALSGFR
jgi:proteasome alpha subunit